MKVANPDSRPARAFTLIEIMIVVAILGLVMTMGIPAIVRSVHKESLRLAVSDIVDICNDARAQAIVRGEMAEARFYPQERRMTSAEMSRQLTEKIAFEMFDVNFVEYKDEEEARVRFYPNGTCDELTIVLHSTENEWRKITLEPMTGFVNVETIR